MADMIFVKDTNKGMVVKCKKCKKEKEVVHNKLEYLCDCGEKIVYRKDLNLTW